MNIAELITFSADAGVFLFVEDERLRFKLSVDEFPPSLKAEILDRKPEIIAFLSKNKQTTQADNRAPVTAKPRQSESYELSYAQQRLWFIDKMLGGSPEYNMAQAFEVSGDFDINAAGQALERVIARHEVLRCVFVERDDKPRQQIRGAVEFSIDYHDLRGLSSAAQHGSINQFCQQDAAKAFDLSQGVLPRVAFLQTSQTSGVLTFNVHHIVSDGWSMAVLVKEFIAQYQAVTSHQPDPLDTLDIQYIDYVSWQRENLSGEAFDQQLAYWQAQLNELPVTHGLMLDHPRSADSSHQAGQVTGVLSVAVAERVKQLALDHNMTPFMLLQGVLALVIARHSNRHDIVLGTVVANRRNSALMPLIGFFVNTLVIRIDTGHQDLAQFLQHVRSVNLDAQDNQDVPFEQLIDVCGVTRQIEHSPLFQIMFSMNNNEVSSKSLGALGLKPMQTLETSAKFELDISAGFVEQGLEICWVYDCGLFNKHHVEQLHDHFQRLLQSVLEPHQTRLGDLTMLSPTEQELLLNHGKSMLPLQQRDLPVQRLFEQHADSNQDKIALITPAGTMTFGLLNATTNRLARHLRSVGVGPGVLVGLFLERSTEVMVAVLAVLKAGGAYVPIEPSYPTARVSHMLSESGLKHILSQSRVSEKQPQDPALWCLHLDLWLASKEVESYSDENIELDKGFDGQNLAYVTFTSGSTGKAKGVMVSHRNWQAYLASAQALYQQGPNDKILQFSSMSFDIFVEEISVSLLSGAPLVLPQNTTFLGSGEFWTLIKNEGVTFATVPTAYWNQLCMDDDLARQCCDTPLKSLVIGGEAMSASLLSLWQQNANKQIRLINTYGPTEATVIASAFDVTGFVVTGQKVPIGTALVQSQLLVLDRDNNLAPAGMVGELCIAGPSVAEGYINQPDMSAAVFLDNPFGSGQMYRTGDMVCWQADGQLAFVGRGDDQVKIRGFRIELGEVEHQLGRLDSVDSALVLALDDCGEKSLVAYVIVDNQIRRQLDDGACIGQLKRQLGGSLPAYMIPTTFVLIEQWPLTVNGKIDKKALPRPNSQVSMTAYKPPVSESEKALVEVWANVLQLAPSQLSIDANFFELGGHSLLIVRLVAQIRRKFGVELPIKTLFKFSTIETLATVIDSGTEGGLTQPITKQQRDGNELPLSFAQQRLWIIDQLNKGSVQYNMPTAFEVHGMFDRHIAADVMRRIIERHEPLRTVMKGQGENAVQLIQQQFEFELSYHDLRQLDETQQNQRLDQIMSEDIHRAFDLSQDLMVRAAFVQLSAKRGQPHGVLVFNMHHIASDGWSIDVLISEFIALYRAICQGQPNPLEPLAVQYADYAHWQRSVLQGERLEKQLSYWQQQLADVPPLHALPLDKNRPAIKQHRGARISGQLPVGVAEQLSALAKAHNVTEFMVLHGALALLLSRHSNTTDIVIGTPVANRNDPKLESLIGFFVNTLVLRVNTDHQFLAQYLGHVKQVHLDAQVHQDTPFELLVKRLNLQRSSAHSPLFQIMLTVDADYQMAQRDLGGDLSLLGVTLSVLQSDEINLKFDLEIDIKTSQDGLSINWVYDTSLFEAQHIAQLNSHLCHLLTGLAKNYSNGTVAIAQLPMLSNDERRLLLEQYSGAVVDYPDQALIHELFETQVALAPSHIAVADSQAELSYAELNARANQLAHYLRGRGVKSDSLVGICLERSIAMVVSILAIVKAGGAYLPLDPDFPLERLGYILEDAAVDVVLTECYLSNNIPLFAEKAVNLDSSAVCEQLARFSVENVSRTDSGANAGSLAYVIYTSGSTGKPKGVALAHRALVNRIDWMDREYGSSAVDTVLQKTPYSFDVSVWEFFWPLVSGAKLVMAKPGGHKDPKYLSGLIQQQQISKIHFVPSMLSSMLQLGDLQNCRSLKQVFCSGEALLVGQLQAFYDTNPEARLINLYGPTEAAIDVSYFNSNADDSSRLQVPIGKAIQNTRLLILNKDLTLCPNGAAGELHIGGVGLARGYLNRQDLTDEAFINDPFSTDSSQRLYKTGDIARWDADGNLEYLGRVDFQVKIRGLRIELGEIESLLSEHPQVGEVVVVAKQIREGDTRLVAYLASNEDALGKLEGDALNAAQQQLTENLRQLLNQKLPQYMVPSAFVVMAKLPLTASGKIDRKQLPDPDFALHQNEYVPPTSAIEIQLCRVWQELLQLKQVGVTDNFFELGGHSLLAIDMVAKLQTQGIQMEAQQLFGAASLGELALAIEQAQQSQTPAFVAPDDLIPADCRLITPQMLPLVELSSDDIATIVTGVPGGVTNIQDIYPLAPLQEGILFHHMMSPDADPYVMPSLFRIKDKPSLDAFLVALQQVIDRHDVLRTAILWQDLPTAVQVVYRKVKLPVEWTSLPLGSDEQSIKQDWCDLQKQWIDLTTAPLLRCKVAADPSTDQYYLLLQIHHLVDDVTSLMQLQSDIIAFMTGRQDELGRSVPYREFVAFALHQAKHHDAEVYFKELLADVDEPTLPFNLSDVVDGGNDVVQLEQKVPAEIAAQLKTLSKLYKVSPAVLFHAAWAVVVSSCSGREDVVFGTVLSGRFVGGAEANSALGMFINNLPLRVNLKSLSIKALIEQVRKALRDLIPYEQTSLALAQSCSALSAAVPLFSAVINYRHNEVVADSEFEQSDYAKSFELLDSLERTNYPMFMSVDHRDEGFFLDVQVDSSIGAERIIGYMQNILVEMASALQRDAETPVSQLSMLGEAESHQLLQQWNDTNRSYPAHLCIHQLFEQQVEQTPDAIALVNGDEQLSYRQLNEAANQLAHYLQVERQVQPDAPVGICVERSMVMVIGMLAILKAGGGYVPLDPGYPEERLSFLLQDARIDTVLTQQGVEHNLPADKVTVLCVDAPSTQQHLVKQPHTNLAVSSLQLRPDHLAYIVYTSGSTGNPKGVLVEHKNVVALVRDCHYYQFDKENVIAQVSNMSFDALTFELWGALCSGARLVQLPKDTLIHTVSLKATLEKYKINTMFTTTALFNLIAQEEPTALVGLRYVLFGGEACSKQAVERILDNGPPGHLIHVYGPTETTTYCVYKELTPEYVAATSKIALGQAISNTQCYVLDKNRNLVPTGVVGELCIGGTGVSRGYANLPELTAAQFINNPFYNDANPASSKRLYKSGDLVRILAGGDLEFMGRVDHQVKIRGFRIELDEIEKALLDHDATNECCVVAVQSESGDKRLVAYISTGAIDWSLQDEEQLTLQRQQFIESIRQLVSSHLPDYMVPSAFILLEKLPITANGKVDRKKLPKPEMLVQQAQYLAPQTATEIRLCEIWQELLDIDQVGVRDNFFDLGGHSLLIMRLLATVESSFTVGLTARAMFEFKDLQSLAAYIDVIKPAADPSSDEDKGEHQQKETFTL